MKACLLPLLGLLALTACIPKPPLPPEKPALQGAYLGQPLPGDTAVLFAPVIVSGPWAERDMAISPTGDELFYTWVSPRSQYQVILRMKSVGNTWSAPEVAPFSGRYSDLEPAFSPDGTRLYFASRRPLDGQGAAKDWDIWYVNRVGKNWSAPLNVGSPINTDADEFYPSVTEKGTLYFTATRPEGKGREDLYRSVWKGSSFGEPENLGDSINTGGYEFNAFIAPDERYLIFSSFGRADGQGGGDLYISRRTESGTWTTARNLGPAVNSPALDYCPFVSPDGSYLFFTSERAPDFNSATIRSYEEIQALLLSPENGNGNLYWVRFDSVNK